MTRAATKLHPIAVVDHVLRKYEDYLRTEFRARDEKLLAAGTR